MHRGRKVPPQNATALTSDAMPINRIHLLLPVLIFAQCSSPDNGGPCNYDVDSIGATIVRMDSTGTPYPDIWLIADNKNGGVDSIRYTNNTGESPVWEVCTERGYAVGAKLKTIRKVRTSGECDPRIFVVKKELWR